MCGAGEEEKEEEFIQNRARESHREKRPPGVERGKREGERGGRGRWREESEREREGGRREGEDGDDGPHLLELCLNKISPPPRQTVHEMPMGRVQFCPEFACLPREQDEYWCH